MPAQKVEPAQQDHQRHDCARKGAGDDGTQHGATGEDGDQAEENDEEQQQAAPLDGRHLLAGRRLDERRFSRISMHRATSSRYTDPCFLVRGVRAWMASVSRM